MYKVGVVIVNFRTPELTLKCVESIIRFEVCPPEAIVVVENCSGDNSFDILSASLPRGVRVHLTEKNAGFGAGVNAGMSAIDARYVLVLNPDTYFIDSSFKHASAILDEEPQVGIAGLDLVYPGGERQWSARTFYSMFDIALRRTFLGRMSFFKERVERHLMAKSWMKGAAFSTDWVMGTGFLVRKSVFDSIGGMDEDYFLYMEDVDLCARVWKSGYRVVCVPGATLVHDHQRSSAAGPFSWAGKQHLRSLKLFRQKYGIPLFSSPGVAGLK